MRCGYEVKKVGVIPSTRESCGYGNKKVSVIPSTRVSCGYVREKVSCDTQYKSELWVWEQENKRNTHNRCI